MEIRKLELREKENTFLKDFWEGCKAGCVTLASESLGALGSKFSVVKLVDRSQDFGFYGHI